MFLYRHSYLSICSHCCHIAFKMLQLLLPAVLPILDKIAGLYLARCKRLLLC